jgi:SAM-dependent methyltransferase
MQKKHKLEKPFPIYQRTSFTTENRMNEWDTRYSELNIKAEQKARTQETEYQSIIDNITSKLLKKEGLKCLELACGSAPWAKYLSEKEIDVECSDYSKVIVERLKNEQGLNAFVAPINNLSAIPDNSYDLIIMAGAIYEDPDPYYVADAYRNISRILKPSGIFIQFLNRFLNFSNRITFIKIQIRTIIFDLIYSRHFRIILRLFRFRLENKNKTVLFWLLPLNLIEAFAKASNMNLCSKHYIQHEVGLAETLFFLPCFKRFDLFSQETAFTNKENIFRTWFLYLANKVRKKKNKHICRSSALVFKKQA